MLTEEDLMLYQIGGPERNKYRYALTRGFNDVVVEAQLNEGEFIDCVTTFSGHLNGEVVILIEDSLSRLRTERDGLTRREQDAIRDLVIKLSGYADVDGSACDSGDPLDLTLTEISQGFTFIENRFYDALTAAYPTMKWPEGGKSAIEIALELIGGVEGEGEGAHNGRLGVQ